ncbi:MAG: NUDIX hydrolase [Alphaproteobacteria bacterium]|nr:NUDIX hydrolase [Alphaproteobacteria bacterium]
MGEPDWLLWARELQAMAQIGLTFTKDPYDSERYEKIRGLAAQMMAAHTSLDAARIEALFTEQSGYATPKIDVRAAVFREDGALLMVRESTDGKWSLPGGWAEVNQSARDAVIREVSEESGFDIEPVKLAAVFDRARHPHVPPRPFSIYKMFFICRITGGAPRLSIETTEIGFFAEHEVPADISVQRIVPHYLDRMFAHYRQPELPAEFD